MNYGYARCSTNEKKQDITRQIRDLQKAGAEEVILEYEHGDSKIKEQLELLLERVGEGDTIITLEVSRLARSTKQLCEVIEIVKEKRLQLDIVGSIKVDCRDGQLDPMSNAFVQMAAVFAELELGITRARIKSGIDNARAKGKNIGRPQFSASDIPSSFMKHYLLYKEKKINLSELARLSGLSRTTVYKYIDAIENKL